jgi:sporulation protein YlmC with PRC-barrel domain
MDPRLLMRVSDLLNVQVTTESGEKLGRVHDLRAERTPRTLKVTGLIIGGVGLLERLGIGAPESTDRIRTRDVVPWSAVIRADSRTIVVRDDARERQ